MGDSLQLAGLILDASTVQLNKNQKKEVDENTETCDQPCFSLVYPV